MASVIEHTWILLLMFIGLCLIGNKQHFCLFVFVVYYLGAAMKWCLYHNSNNSNGYDIDIVYGAIITTRIRKTRNCHYCYSNHVHTGVNEGAPAPGKCRDDKYSGEVEKSDSGEVGKFLQVPVLGLCKYTTVLTIPMHRNYKRERFSLDN